MKCCSENEKLHKLIDEECSEEEKNNFEKHLSICRECRDLFDSIRQTRTLLIAQPAILPGNKFDQKILGMIDKKTAKHVAKEGFWSFLSSLPLKLSFAALIGILSLGIAFQLGRISVSAPSVSNSAQNSLTEKDSKSAPIAEKANILQPQEKIITQIKTVTKYVQIPVIKKVKKEKIVYVNSFNADTRTPNLPKQKTADARETVARQFNLKDLQPVEEVAYQIIRTGKNNE